MREIKEPAALRSVTVFFRGRYRLGDEDLRHLASASRLETLDLPGVWRGNAAQITDAGMVHIARLSHLTRLSICSNALTDASLGKLAQLRNLRSLALRSSSITDAGIARLRYIPGLISLTLRVPMMTDAGLAQLDSFDHLIDLDLCGTAVSGVGFVTRDWRSLTTLQGNFTDDGLKWLSRPDVLGLNYMSLSVVGQGVSDAGLRSLARMPRTLSSLSLQDTLVTEQGLRDLRSEKPLLRDLKLLNGGRRPVLGPAENIRKAAHPIALRYPHTRRARQRPRSMERGER